MANILLAHSNRIDAATLSGGAWAAALPLTNLQDRRIAKVARTTSAALASTKFAFDHLAAKAQRAFAIAYHNVTTAGLWRLRLGTLPVEANPGSVVYDSGWVSALRLTFRTEAPAAWGTKYPLMLAFDEITARYGLVEFNDTANAAGYLQFGRPFVGPALQPTWNPSHEGAAHGLRDLSAVLESNSGADYGTARRRQRTEDFSLPWTTDAEAEWIHELMMEAGTVDEALYVPDPANPAKNQRYGFIGRLRELSQIEAPFADMNSVSVRLQERLP